MLNFKPVFALGFSLLLAGCSGNDKPLESSNGTDTTNPIIVEIEEWTGRFPGTTLDWQPIQIAESDGFAAKVVSANTTASSTNLLPTLTYELEISEIGTYQITLQGRHDSNFPTRTEQHTVITFGSDTGNTELAVNGFDDQWQSIEHDITGQTLSITVTTPGEHLFKIASPMIGLMLDQMSLTRQGAANPESDSIESGATPDVTENQAPVPDSDQEQAQSNQSPPEETNTAPSASISGQAQATARQAISLRATGYDDGLPHGQIYYYWSALSGPGQVTFTTHTRASTDAIFSAAGTYELQVNVNDGELYSNHQFTVTVAAAAPAETGEPPQSNQLGSQWKTMTTNGKVTARHEAGGVAVNGKLYVLGGRGNRPVDMYNPVTNKWSAVADTPFEMHHFQPVAIDSKIYVIGAFTCCYPREQIVSHVYTFDTTTNTWSKGAEIPANRQRGSAGAAIHNGKIYLLGGNTNGHAGGAVGWFDEFNPATGEWKKLADAPDARDHATIAIVNNKLVAAAGRRSDLPNTFLNTVLRTNVYDFSTGRWSREANIPTARAGTMTVSHHSDVLVIGGESASDAAAHNDVEAYNINTKKWRKLNSLNIGRHGGAAAFIDGSLHVVTGNTKRGGGRESTSHEVLQ